MRMRAIWEIRLENFLCVLSKVRAEYAKVAVAMEGIATAFLATEASSLGLAETLAATEQLRCELEESRILEEELLDALGDLAGINFPKALPEVLKVKGIRESLEALVGSEAAHAGGSQAADLAAPVASVHDPAEDMDGGIGDWLRTASLSEIVTNRHASNVRTGDEVGEDFDGFPEGVKLSSDRECSVSLRVSFSQADLESVLLALHSLLDVVERSGRGGACSHCCHSSSSVRCGGRTCSCGVDGTSQPTGEGAARSTGGGGLSGSSAVTPTDRSAGHPRFKFLRRREDDAARD